MMMESEYFCQMRISGFFVLKNRIFSKSSWCYKNVNIVYLLEANPLQATTTTITQEIHTSYEIGSYYKLFILYIS